MEDSANKKQARLFDITQRGGYTLFTFMPAARVQVDLRSILDEAAIAR
jgi:hypothetical protein